MNYPKFAVLLTHPDHITVATTIEARTEADAWLPVVIDGVTMIPSKVLAHEDMAIVRARAARTVQEQTFARRFDAGKVRWVDDVLVPA